MANEKQFTVRMDEDLYSDLIQAAKDNRRSIAKEIESAVAYYLREMNKKRILHNIDVDKMDEESSKAFIKKLIAIDEKYNIFTGLV